MELSFAVPFVTIPVKKTIDATKGALLNINLGAIILSGMVMLGAAFATPLLIHIFTKMNGNQSAKGDDGKYRSKIFWFLFFS